MEVLNRRVRSREEQPLLARVAPADDVRRPAAGAVHLEDFPVAVRLAHAMALHDDTVTHNRLHEDLPSVLLPATFRRFPRSARRCRSGRGEGHAGGAPRPHGSVLRRAAQCRALDEPRRAAPCPRRDGLGHYAPSGAGGPGPQLEAKGEWRGALCGPAACGGVGSCAG